MMELFSRNVETRVLTDLWRAKRGSTIEIDNTTFITAFRGGAAAACASAHIVGWMTSMSYLRSGEGHGAVLLLRGGGGGHGRVVPRDGQVLRHGGRHRYRRRRLRGRGRRGGGGNRGRPPQVLLLLVLLLLLLLLLLRRVHEGLEEGGVVLGDLCGDGGQLGRRVRRRRRRDGHRVGRQRARRRGVAWQPGALQRRAGGRRRGHEVRHGGREVGVRLVPAREQRTGKG